MERGYRPNKPGKQITFERSSGEFEDDNSALDVGSEAYDSRKRKGNNSVDLELDSD